MKIEQNFKFLKVELMKKKKTEENQKETQFLILNLLDEDNNPCRFFVFNTDLISKITKSSFLGLQDVICTLEIKFNNNWSVNLLDID